MKQIPVKIFIKKMIFIRELFLVSSILYSKSYIAKTNRE